MAQTSQEILVMKHSYVFYFVIFILFNLSLTYAEDDLLSAIPMAVFQEHALSVLDPNTQASLACVSKHFFNVTRIAPVPDRIKLRRKKDEPTGLYVERLRRFFNNDPKFQVIEAIKLTSDKKIEFIVSKGQNTEVFS